MNNYTNRDSDIAKAKLHAALSMENGNSFCNSSVIGRYFRRRLPARPRRSPAPLQAPLPSRRR